VHIGKFSVLRRTLCFGGDKNNKLYQHNRMHSLNKAVGVFGQKRFLNKPQSLRCDLTVPCLCFLLFECLYTGHSSDGFGDPIKYGFTCWIRVTCCSFLNLHLRFSTLSRAGKSLLRPKSVILLVDSLYAEATEAVKSRADLSASSSKLIFILA
jgi:hypothetical protein